MQKYVGKSRDTVVRTYSSVSVYLCIYVEHHDLKCFVGNCWWWRKLLGIFFIGPTCNMLPFFSYAKLKSALSEKKSIQKTLISGRGFSQTGFHFGIFNGILLVDVSVNNHWNISDSVFAMLCQGKMLTYFKLSAECGLSVHFEHHKLLLYNIKFFFIYKILVTNLTYSSSCRYLTGLCVFKLFSIVVSLNCFVF